MKIFTQDSFEKEIYLGRSSGQWLLLPGWERTTAPTEQARGTYIGLLQVEFSLGEDFMFSD